MGRGSTGAAAAAVLAFCLMPRMAAPEPGAGRQAGDALRLDLAAAQALFDRNWVAAPASTRASDGLGPLYNARSCAACHPGAGETLVGGAGPAPDGLVLRLSAPEGTGAGKVGVHPLYGRQLQTHGIAGVPAEGRLAIGWTETAIPLAGGWTARLRQPWPQIEAPAYGSPGPTLMSLRRAPRLAGLGLLDTVPEALILAAADPQDEDGDGISGRANRDADGRLGRFGWKAALPTLRQQVALAFADDIGMSSDAHPDPWGDCRPAEAQCRAAPSGADASGYELSSEVIDLVTLLVAAIGPPQPRPGEALATRGRQLFDDIGCGLCHRTDLTAETAPGQSRPDTAGVAAYTDLLLHDMGEGLADGRPDGAADGREWRTAPLWGMGGRADGAPASYLHDGRARTPLEAILWHGGEAERMRDRVISMTAGDRAALLAFLDSL